MSQWSTILPSLDPFDAGMNMNLGDHLLWAGRVAESAAPIARAVEIHPTFQRGWLRLARARALAGDHQAAAPALAKASELARDLEAAVPGLATVEALLGRRSEARARLDDLPSGAHVSPLDVAEAYAALGDADAAFSWLDRAIAARSCWLIFLALEPLFANLRGDPRFSRCLEQVGLAGAS